MMTFWETKEQIDDWYKNPEHLALVPIVSPLQKIHFDEETAENITNIWEVTDALVP